MTATTWGLISVMRIDRRYSLLQLALTIVVVGAAAGAHGWETDWDLDTELAVLDQPVRRPIIIPFGDGRQRGAPLSPGWNFYKQQPAGAQGDFRNLAPGGQGAPSGSLPTVPSSQGTSGSGNTDGSIASATNGTSTSDMADAAGSGGTANEPGNSNNNNPNQPPGPQLPPPEVEPPEIPLPPIPPIAPPGGGLF